jgi:hypothetical protein
LRFAHPPAHSARHRNRALLVPPTAHGRSANSPQQIGPMGLPRPIVLSARV